LIDKSNFDGSWESVLCIAHVMQLHVMSRARLDLADVKGLPHHLEAPNVSPPIVQGPL